jgi:hypothetical protein
MGSRGFYGFDYGSNISGNTLHYRESVTYITGSIVRENWEPNAFRTFHTKSIARFAIFGYMRHIFSYKPEINSLSSW